MSQQSSIPVLRGCILAAGEASRFGASKLLEDFDGKPLLQHSLLAARDSRIDTTCLVVGNDGNKVAAAADGLVDKVVVNSFFAEGIGTSIACGVNACASGADAIVILLGDQPLVTAAHLDNLCDTWSGADKEVVVTAFDGVKGPPVLFPSGAFSRLSQLRGDNGAKSVLASRDFTVRRVPFSDAKFDIDTPDDLAQLRRRYSGLEK